MRHDQLFRRLDNYSAGATWRYRHWAFCNPTFQARSTKRVSPSGFANSVLVSHFGFHPLLVPSTQSASITSRSNTRSQAFSSQASQDRSEEQTSELQSLMLISNAVFCLKKKLQTSTNYRFTLSLS